jgi:hypothetical protein
MTADRRGYEQFPGFARKMWGTGKVAQRIGRYAGLVGAENVIAGTDCGFATFVTHVVVEPEITWAKLATLAEGARRASERPGKGCPVRGRRSWIP